MVSLIALFLMSLFFLLLLSSCVKSPVKEFEEKEKAKVISFEQPDVCATCHDTIFNQWRTTMHSYAFVDPFYWAEAELAGKEAGDKVRNFCHSCHSPGGVLTGKIPADATKASPTAKAGVFCDFCHTVKKSKGIGNASYIVETGSIKRGPYKDSFSPYHETEYSELHTKAEFCGMCHDVYHPLNKLPIELTYTEWKEGPYSKEGIVCQDCHMTPGPQITKPNPGVVAIGGPEREHWWTHHTVGANVFMSRYLGNDVAAKLAEERLKSAARVEVLNVIKSKDRVAIKVKISNVGAGHKLPTGLTVFRQMWIEVIARDASGKVVYSYGTLNKDGSLPSNTKIFNTVFGDKSGKPTMKIWEAEKILYDYRIPPKGFVTEVFEFRITSATLPINVQIRLLYRSAPQEIINKLMKDKPIVPVVEMEKTSIKI